MRTQINRPVERTFHRFAAWTCVFLDRGQATSPSCHQPSSFHCLRISNFHIYWLQLELWTLNIYAKLCLRSSFPLFLSLTFKPQKWWLFCSAHLNIPLLHVCVKIYFLMHLLNLSCSAFLLIDSQGIIEDVVLLGAPVEGEAKYWKAITKVVSGRIINGYCRSVRAQSPASLSYHHFEMILHIYPF